MEHYCERCGKPIADFNFLKEHGYEHEAKYCEQCRRNIRHYRVTMNVERTLLAEWINVAIRRLPIEYEKTTKDGKMVIFRFGGRFFDKSNWGGASYSQKILFFVDSSLVKGEELIKERVVHIRKMLKVISKENKGERTNEYFVIEPAGSNIPERYVDFLLSYYKTTMKGYGRDRDYKEECISDHEVIAEVSSSARSGRFGNSHKIIIIETDDYKIEGGGLC